jgi:hypothetical protein
MVPVVQITTPAGVAENNGNWRTAQRWARLLATEPGCGGYEVILQAPDAPVVDRADLLIALHATRSHDAILEWRRTHGERPVALILTGTDLYRDLPIVESTQASLARADALVVLQSHAVRDLPRAVRDKAQVIYQSSRDVLTVFSWGTCATRKIR